MSNILAWKGKHPQIGNNVFIAKGSHLIGEVVLGDGASVFYGAVLRGDINFVRVGARTNIQDNATLHVADKFGVQIGEGCTIGHNAVVHACTIGDNVTVGMGAIVMDGTVIGNDCLVAAGALVPPGKSFPDGSLIVGSPAKLGRALTADEIEGMRKMAVKYMGVADEHRISQQEHA